MKATEVIKEIVIPFSVSLAVEITMILIQKTMNNINIFNIILYILIFILLIVFIIYRIKGKRQIVKIYENYNDSKKDIFKDCDNSNKIILFGISGYPFSHLDGFLHKYLFDNKIDKTIIIANPNNKYLEERAADIKVDLTSYRSDLQSSINILNNELENKHIKLILHNERPLFHYVLLDNYLYLSFYQNGQTLSQNKVYKLGKSSELYRIFDKHSTSFIN